MSPRTSLVTALVGLLVGCTFNAGAVRASRASETETFGAVRADLREVGLTDGLVRVTGAPRVGALATATVSGLSSRSNETVAAGIRLGWTRDVDTMVLSVGYAGPDPDSVWLDELSIELPNGTDIDLETRSATLEIVDPGGDVRVRADGGSTDVATTGAVDLVATSGGSIDVAAGSGTVATEYGAITLDVSGDVVATTEGGAITGRLETGGTLETGSGRISVDLGASLARDVEITSHDGSVVLGVPSGASLDLDLATEGGSIHVAAGGVTHDGATPFTGRVGAGGFLVTVRVGPGSIRIEER